MTFSRKPAEPIPEVETKIWACKSDDCNGWMRHQFSLNAVPSCPLCGSEMAEETRVLPEIQS